MGRIEEALRKAKVSRGAEVDPHSRVDNLRHRESVSAARNSPLTVEKPNISDRHIVQLDKEVLREQRVIAASQHDERVGDYRQLRTMLLKNMRDHNWSTLAISSCC